MSSASPSDRRLIADRYRVLEEIAEGGRVLKAHDRRHRRIVALRRLPLASSDDPATLSFVGRLARLEHPNVARVLELVEDAGDRFLVAEFVDGTDLDRVVRHRGPLALRQALDVAIQAARGLGAAHALGIVHGGLTPSALMLEAGGGVRVLPPIPGASARTDPRDDIFSLGCLLHFLLTGRPPFVGETPRDRPAPDIRVVRPDVPSTVAKACQAMMATRPEDRPASMAEVIRLLDPDHPVPIGPEFDLSGLGIEGRRPARPEHSPRDGGAAVASAPQAETSRSGRDARPIVALGLVAIVVLIAVVAQVAPRTGDAGPRTAAPPPAIARPVVGKSEKDATPPPEPEWVARTIFDGRDASDWMLSSKRPVPRGRVQPDGLNPHGTGSFLVVYRQKLGDFILDLDYKLGRGSRTAVYLRVGDLNDPVNTGVAVSLADTDGAGDEDSGAIRGLVAPSRNAQKPAGQWNHMSIKARGPAIIVTLNGIDVSRIRLDEWTGPGPRQGVGPDATGKISPASRPRSGYIGFQDLVGDCWFRDIVVRTPAGSK